MPRSTHRRVVFASRPQGAITSETFRVEEAPLPALAAGHVLLRTVYLSLDPYMRGRLVDGPSYGQLVALGDVMLGATVSRVETSEHADFTAGDLVLGNAGWQELSVSNGTDLSKIDDSFVRPSYALGVLGMPGFTAYHGLLEIGAPQPGETVVVAAATGAAARSRGRVGQGSQQSRGSWRLKAHGA